MDALVSAHIVQIRLAAWHDQTSASMSLFTKVCSLPSPGANHTEAPSGDWTHDRTLTKRTLYQLSYRGIPECQKQTYCVSNMFLPTVMFILRNSFLPTRMAISSIHATQWCFLLYFLSLFSIFVIVPCGILFFFVLLPHFMPAKRKTGRKRRCC